jgi:hypothetical protein
MTLREQIIDRFSEMDLEASPTQKDIDNYILSINHLEKIADEFAIGFAKWCKQEYELEDTSFHNKWRDVNGEYRETKELLEIYKKEKYG